jgi:subtilisin family serine protease
MRGWRIVVAVVVTSLLSVLALASWRVVGPGAARADDTVVSPALKAQVASTGRARVIVEVRLPTPFVPEENLPGRAYVVMQRASLQQAQSRVLSRLQGLGHTFLHSFETVPYLVLEVESDALSELEASSADVVRVLEDAMYDPLLAQSVPLVEGPEAWAEGFDASGMTIAIVDTGVDKAHPFLAGKVVEEACYSTSVFGVSASLCPGGQPSATGPGTAIPCAIGGPSDVCWHGTHVAGIAAGNGAGAGVSYSGVAKGAQIMAVKVFSKGTSQCSGPPPCLKVYTSDVIKGLERVYAVRGLYTFGAVNVSIGGGLNGATCDGDPTKPIIDNLRAAGIAAVFASGNNSYVNSTNAPACVSTAVSVGNTGKDDVVWPSSNVASFLSLFAPGGNILSSSPGGAWRVSSGTSMSAPHVTGAFAVLKQAAPGASVTELLNALQQTGVPIADTRPGGFVAAPRIRIAAALAALSPQPPQTLSVASANPASGVGITLSPLDTGGNGSGPTPLARTYAFHTVVTLTAPLTAASKTFQKWQRDGVDWTLNLSVPVTMDADHTLTAVYVQSTFADVLPSHPFWSSVERIFAAGITTGCGTDPAVFCPTQVVNRAQMAVFLLRAIHGAAYTPPPFTGTFADVANDAFGAWIDELYAEGIVTGCATNPLRYCPGQGVTRAQMAILLLRAKYGAGHVPPAASGLFADVPAGDPAAPWVEELYTLGLTSGCGTNPLRYCPTQGVTRAEMAAFLVRTFNL